MANTLRKLKKVTAYTAMTADAAECWEVLQFLKDNNIPYQLLNWHDDTALQGLYDSLGTWNWYNGVEVTHKTFTKLPIVHWEGVWEGDDDIIATDCAVGLEELKNSVLLANLDKLVR